MTPPEAPQALEAFLTKVREDGDLRSRMDALFGQQSAEPSELFRNLTALSEEVKTPVPVEIWETFFARQPELSDETLNTVSGGLISSISATGEPMDEFMAKVKDHRDQLLNRIIEHHRQQHPSR